MIARCNSSLSTVKARAIAPGTPYYLLPASIAGFDQNTADIHARQSFLGAAFEGPQIGSLQAGGLLQVFFYNDNAFADAYGILPLQAWGDLKNENWRFAAGYQFDVFNPNAPTILPFSILCGSGNTGNASRGMVRLERFLYPSDNAQWTLQFALSEPITSVYDPSFSLSEDNGWPNVEGRIALEQTFDRFGDWHVDESEVDWVHTSTVRGYHHVPIHF